MPILAQFPIRTVKGTTIDVTLSTTEPSVDGRLLTRGIAGERSGWLNRPYMIPLDAKRGPGNHYAKLLAVGATHHARLGELGILALDAATADLLSTAMDDAEAVAQRMRREADEAREATIRATFDVRRVLSHAENWGGYAMSEAYADDADTRYNRDAKVRFALPGREEIKLHQRCPSLHEVAARSPYWGAFPGHSNGLFLISDADWALLLGETADLRASDGAAEDREIARQIAETNQLKTIKVPTEAITAFRRFAGDPERAWEQEDERAASQIRQYGAAIEAQGIAFAAVRQDDLPIHPAGA